jgi:predicted unusual protein kinase regulating ubiquinone biosynthesis (AarF/ABC1/UbiB family)
MKETPISSFDRTKVVLKTTAKVGAIKSKEIVKRAFLSQEKRQEVKDSVKDEVAKVIFENISLLKGTAVKIAQSLALHNILPLSLQKELTKSYNSIEPINQALVMKIVQNEFQKFYYEVFKEFELKPFASASLGQVHRAKTFDGESIAVKIQYPSIDKTIKSDINLIRKLIPLKKNISDIIDEIEDKLYDEIDYKKEALNTKWAYKNFQTENSLVPKVYDKYSTRHILTTEYIEGVDLFSWLKTNPTKKQKELVANEIFHIFIKSIFELKQIQADPNPANYLITKENKVALIDFGCVKKFDEDFIAEFINIMRIYTLDDREKILQAYKEIELISDKANVSDAVYQGILRFNRWAVKPILSDSFVFTKEYLDVGVEFTDFFTKKPFKVVRDYIFLDRTMHGLWSLFEQMGVDIDMREYKGYLNL